MMDGSSLPTQQRIIVNKKEKKKTLATIEVKCEVFALWQSL
jgi:hypothetical protein